MMMSIGAVRVQPSQPVQNRTVPHRTHTKYLYVYHHVAARALHVSSGQSTHSRYKPSAVALNHLSLQLLLIDRRKDGPVPVEVYS